MTPTEASRTRDSLRQMEALYRLHNRLFLLHLDLTWRCPLQCHHCYLGPESPSGPSELPGRDWVSVLEEARRLQVVRVVLSGGDPMLHRDFLDILLCCASLGFSVLVKTTGWRLGDPGVLDHLARVPFLSVDISLHHLDPEVHDSFTGRRGSHQVAQAAIRALRHRGIPVRITRSLVMGVPDDQGALRRWCDARHLPLMESLVVLPVRKHHPDSLPGEPRGRQAMPWPDDWQRAALRRLWGPGARRPSLPEPDGALCAAGQTRLYIDPSGAISPCVAWPRPVGHVRDGLARVLRSAALREVRRIRQRHREACRHCPWLAVCDFCPGLAQQTTGSPLRPYPLACLLARIRDEVLPREQEPSP